MSVNTYLQELSGKLILSDSENESITTSINAIKKNLNSYFASIIELKIFGSYSRNTILPRKIDSESDIDLMVVFSNPYKYKPQTFLNYLKSFAEHYYSRSEIYQSSPTVVLELNHIKFELTPAYLLYGSYYIPKGPSEWKYTNPTALNVELIECNKLNNYQIKPIIRLIKYWNICQNKRNLESYRIEKLIAENMKFSYLSCSSYTDYLKKALNILKYETDTSRVNNAINCINFALFYESEKMPYSALSEIKKVFPEV